MKAAVIGPGSMGLLYGSRLSACADVCLVGRSRDHVDEMNEKGITVRRGEEERLYRVRAVLPGEEKEAQDLIILFTKAYITREALAANRNLIGKDTLILTLQNGAGHEDILREFTDDAHILIGTTTQGSYRENIHTIVNSGLGDTVIGRITKGDEAPDSCKKVQEIAELFEKAGFPCKVSDNIRFTVWNKLMINASSSLLSGVLGKPQGFVAENAHAWEICCDLIREICKAAEGEGCHFDYEEQRERLRKHLEAAPGGYTSIYSDLQNKRKTEADYISGAVVRAARKQGWRAHTHEIILNLVHAMEA
jgi:2-dehydropantoate 2-reductase